MVLPQARMKKKNFICQRVSIILLWQVEQDFDAAKIEEEKVKIRTATIYLSDDAILWWRRRHSDVERGLCTSYF